MTGQSGGDTDEAVARVHLELLRRASPDRRVQLALSLSDTVLHLACEALRRTLPAGTTPEEVGVRFVALHYGPELAEGVRRALARKQR